MNNYNNEVTGNEYEELPPSNTSQIEENSFSEVNNNYVEIDEDKFFNEEKKGIKNKGIVIPIVLSLVILILSIPSINDVFFSKREGLEFIMSFLILFIRFGVLCLIWIIYLIILTIVKISNKEKNWWIPALIVALIILAPKAILFVNKTKQGLNDPQVYTSINPEIKSFDKISDIPIYNEYKVLGKDMNEYDVYKNAYKYKNTKVLVQGIPSYKGTSTSSHDDTEKVNIFNENNEDELLYSFTFVDENSEFSNDNYMFFVTENTKLDDYYTYIYGEIISVQTNSDSGKKYKIINIKPEKIYYTLYHGTALMKKNKVVYSDLFKIESKLSNKQILSCEL